MARFCTNCGKEIPDGVAFCTECGTKAPAEETAPVITEAAVSEPQAAAPVCEKCGAVLAEGVAFCTECGTPREGVASPPPRQTYTPPPQQVYTAPVYAQPAPAYATATDESERVVGTGIFFGLNFLFGVPIIGWIACLLMAFTPKNKNIKHYARAMLIWLLIGTVIWVGLFFALRGIVKVAKEYVGDIIEEYTGQNEQPSGGQAAQNGQNNTSGVNTGDTGGIFDTLGQLGELGELFGQLGGLTGGDLSGLPTE